MEPIKLEYRYTEDVAVQASMEITRSLSKSYTIIPWLGAVLTVMAVVRFAITGDTSGYAVLPFFLGIFFMMVPRMGIRKIRRHFRMNPMANKPLTWHIDESGLRNETEGAETRFDWDNVVKAVERKAGFILFMQARLGYWLPKEAFQGEQQMEAFRGLIRDKGLSLKGKA